MVEYTIQRLAHFDVPLIREHEWRHVGDGTHKPASKRTEEEAENGPNDLIFADDILCAIAVDMLGGDEAVIETMTGGPSITITVDLDVCAYDVQQVQRGLEALHKYVEDGNPVQAWREPYIANRGTEDYYDPVRVVPHEYVVPDPVRDALGRPKKKGKTCPAK